MKARATNKTVLYEAKRKDSKSETQPEQEVQNERVKAPLFSSDEQKEAYARVIGFKSYAAYLENEAFQARLAREHGFNSYEEYQKHRGKEKHHVWR